MPDTCIKDPDAVLDYAWDWKALTHGTGLTDWLAAGETITAHTVTASAVTLTVDSSAVVDGLVTAWLSGGTVGIDYTVTCHITTSAGREDDRTMTIRVMER